MPNRLWDDWETLHELRADPHVLDLVAEAFASGSELQVQTRLRAEFPDRLVRAAVSLHELRRKAVAKFSRAAAMWFDRQGLEQATSEAVASHKARRFDTGGTPVPRVWDFCCGIGADAIALAERCDVIAVDVRPENCIRTLWNAGVYGRSDRVVPVCADVEQFNCREGWLHIDPDRRASRGATGRVVRIEDYVPGLEFLQHLTRDFRGGAIKLSPAANFGGKFPGTEIELVSLDGECKEATVWFGELAGSTAWRATVLECRVSPLPSGGEGLGVRGPSDTTSTLTGDPLAAVVDFSEPLRYVFDPDPAVVRAGLVDVLAVQLALHRLDAEEEYLTSDRLVASPFVRGFEVLANLPNNDRAIRDFFRGSNFGDVEIKCRHIPIHADATRRKLPLPGNARGTLIFARVGGKSRAIVCRRLPGDAP